MSDKVLGIILKAQADITKAVDDLKTGMKDAERQAASSAKKTSEEYERSFEKIRNASAVAFAGFAVAIGFAVKEAAEGEQAMAGFKSAVLNAGGDADQLSERLDEAALRLQRLTGIADDDFVAAAARMTDMTKDASGAINQLGLVADFSSARKIDMATAADAVARAMTGEAGRLAMLLPGLDDEIKALGESATAAQRKAVIMERLSQFEGRAADAAKTTTGEINKLKAEISATVEEAGKPFLEMVSNLAADLRPIIESLGRWIGEHQELVKVIGTGALAMSGFLVVVTGIGTWAPKAAAGILLLRDASFALMRSPWAAVAASIAAVAALGYQLSDAMTSTGKSEADLNKIVTDTGVAYQTLRQKQEEIFGKFSDYKSATDEQRKAWDEYVLSLYAAIPAMGPMPAEFDALTASIAGLNKELPKIAKPDMWDLEDMRMSSVPQVEEVIPQETLDAMPGRMSAAMLATREVYQREMDELGSYDAQVWLTELENTKTTLAEREAEFLRHTEFMQSAFSTMVHSFTDIEMTGKQRREAIWNSLRSSFIRQVGQQVQAHLFGELAKQHAIKMTTGVQQGAFAQSLASSIAHGLKEISIALQTAAARIYAFYASLGPFGIPAAAATVAGVLAAVRSLKFQRGGIVPGVGYGDHVPALLEPGEYVVNRRATQQNRGTLEAINNGRAGLGGQTNVTVNIALDGEGLSLQRKLEIRDLVEDMLPGAIERALDRRRLSLGLS